MKLHFEPNLDYQLAAIESVCDLFRGQQICRTEFTVTRDAAGAQQGLMQIIRDFCEHSNAVCDQCPFPDFLRGNE